MKFLVNCSLCLWASLMSLEICSGVIQCLGRASAPWVVLGQLVNTGDPACPMQEHRNSSNVLLYLSVMSRGLGYSFALWDHCPGCSPSQLLVCCKPDLWQGNVRNWMWLCVSTIWEAKALVFYQHWSPLLSSFSPQIQNIALQELLWLKSALSQPKSVQYLSLATNTFDILLLKSP